MSDEPIQTNAADPEQVATGARTQKEIERRQLARWRQQLSTREGREFLWEEIFGELKLFAWIATDDGQALGVRNTAVKFWAYVHRHPDLFLQMQNEAVARVKGETEGRKAARSPRTTDTTT